VEPAAAAAAVAAAAAAAAAVALVMFIGRGFLSSDVESYRGEPQIKTPS